MGHSKNKKYFFFESVRYRIVQGQAGAGSWSHRNTMILRMIRRRRKRKRRICVPTCRCPGAERRAGALHHVCRRAPCPVPAPSLLRSLRARMSRRRMRPKKRGQRLLSLQKSNPRVSWCIASTSGCHHRRPRILPTRLSVDVRPQVAVVPPGAAVALAAGARRSGRAPSHVRRPTRPPPDCRHRRKELPLRVLAG